MTISCKDDLYKLQSKLKQLHDRKKYNYYEIGDSHQIEISVVNNWNKLTEQVDPMAQDYYQSIPISPSESVESK